MATQEEDLAGMIAELEAHLRDATPEMRGVLEMQIQSSRQALALLASSRPAIDAMKQHRPALSDDVRAFFTPEPPAQLPTWVPDGIVRAEVTEATLRCPPEARVYYDEVMVGCAVPMGPGSVPVGHGLTLGFYKSGRLASQRFYDRSLLRWDIEYHPLGGRSSVGFYADRERMQYAAHGLVTSYAANGAVVGQAWWHEGQRHGWSKLWEDDGFPVVATLYERDRPVEEARPDGSRRRF